MPLTRVIIAASMVLLVSACSRSVETTDTSVARLRCLQPGTTNQYVACDLTLQERGGFELVLTFTECTAPGSIVRLTAPVQQTLTSDGCTVPVGTDWTFPGPYEAGTRIALEIQAPRLRNDPEIRVAGAWPSWTLNYEDGGDQDFNDLILTLNGLPE